MKPSVFSLPGQITRHPGRYEPSLSCAALVHAPAVETALACSIETSWKRRLATADARCSRASTPRHADAGYAALRPNAATRSPLQARQRSVRIGSCGPRFPNSFRPPSPGSRPSRDGFLIDVDLDRLKARIADYFDKDLSHEEITRRYPNAMETTGGFPARAVRKALVARGGPTESGFVRFAYRPFDVRWLYWEAETTLLDRKRAEYRPHVFKGNKWLCANEREVQSEFSQGTYTSHLGNLKYGYWGIQFFPAWLRGGSLRMGGGGLPCRPNLSAAAAQYLERLDATVEDLFHHVLAKLHDPEYRRANAGALTVGWPRIPVPGWPDGQDEDAQQELLQAAARGRKLARLLDPDTPVSGVTEGSLRAELAALAVPATTDGGNMSGSDFALTAGWGHFGTGDAVMPGIGRAVPRPFTPSEHPTLAATLQTLGETTLDIWLNDHAFWRNVPAAVWNYRLGGYQVLKKWLSYRERSVLKRPLHPEEVQHFTDTARRIAAILLLTTGAAP